MAKQKTNKKWVRVKEWVRVASRVIHSWTLFLMHFKKFGIQKIYINL